MTPPSPSDAASATATRSDVPRVLHDAGHRRDRRRGVERPRARTAAARDRPACSRVSATSRRSAGVRRSRRGRSAGKRHDQATSPCGGRRRATLARSPHGLAVPRRAASRSDVAVLGERLGQRRRPTGSRRGRRRAGRAPRRSSPSAGPMQATTVEACGLPAMPIRLRTVLDEVNSTASKPPVLMASRVSAAAAEPPARCGRR